MITKEHIKALTEVKFDLLKSKVILKNNLELRNIIEADLVSQMDLQLPEVASGRLNFFKINGATSDDFKERIIEIDSNHFLMAGIRFRGLNINKPFIEVIPNYTPSADSLPQWAELIKKEFSIFKPQCFQFSMPSEHQYPDLTIDRHTVVGNVKELLKVNLPTSTCKITLEEFENTDFTDFYDSYLNEYTLFHKAAPHLIDEVKPESLEDLSQALQDKLLYKIIIDGVHAGIIAGSFSEYYGLKSVYIIEEILYNSFRGKGMGAYIQKAYLEKVQNKCDYLWGTISDMNQSSLKTALKNGRKIEEIQYIYKL